MSNKKQCKNVPGWHALGTVLIMVGSIMMFFLIYPLLTYLQDILSSDTGARIAWLLILFIAIMVLVAGVVITANESRRR